MANSTIKKPNINTMTLQVSGNASNTIQLPTPYTEALIFVYRVSLANGGLYANDSWGQITTIVAAPNVIITKDTTSSLVTVTNNNGFAIRAKVLIF